MTSKVIEIDLGDLGGDTGATDAPVVHTFPWYGVTVRVNPGASEMVYLDFIEEAGQYDESDSRGAVAVKEFIREMIHPDDFDVFWDLAKTHRRQIKDLANISMRIVAQVSGDPTSGQPDSSNGLSVISGSSTDARYAPVITELEKNGRPDLAVIYDDARLNGAMG